MFSSQLLSAAALMCSIVSAIPIPQIASSSASTTGASSAASSSTSGIRTGAYATGDLAFGDDGSWPWSQGGDGTTTEAQAKTINLPDGYSLYVMSVSVAKEGDSFRQNTTIKFLDNKSVENHQTSTPTGTCTMSVLESDLKPSMDYSCSPASFVLVHKQNGKLRGDGSQGSTPSFSVELYAGDNAGHMGTTYSFNFAPSLWSNVNVTAGATAPPFTNTLKTLEYGILFNSSSSTA